MRIKARCQTVFIAAYCLYLVASILPATQFQNLNFADLLIQAMRYIAAGGIAASFLMMFIKERRIDRRWLISALCFGVLCLIVLISNRRETETILLYLFVIWGAVLIDSDRIFKWYIVTVSAVVLLTLLLYVVGVYQYDYIMGRGNVRLYLGFTYTTYLPNFFFHLLLVYFAVRKRKINLAETVVICIANCIIFWLTNTQAVFFEVFLLLAILWILNFGERPFRSKVFEICMAAVMPVLAGLSYLMTFLYDPSKSFWIKLNSALSNRLALQQQAIGEYGVSFFGTNTTWITGRLGIERTEDYFYVDCSYMNIGFTFGIVVLILVVAAFSVLGVKAQREHKYVLCVALLLLAVHSFTDPQLLELRYDPFLLLLAKCFLDKKNPIPLPVQTEWTRPSFKNFKLLIKRGKNQWQRKNP